MTVTSLLLVKSRPFWTRRWKGVDVLIAAGQIVEKCALPQSFAVADEGAKVRPVPPVQRWSYWRHPLRWRELIARKFRSGRLRGFLRTTMTWFLGVVPISKNGGADSFTADSSDSCFWPQRQVCSMLVFAHGPDRCFIIEAALERLTGALNYASPASRLLSMKLLILFMNYLICLALFLWKTLLILISQFSKTVTVRTGKMLFVQVKTVKMFYQHLIGCIILIKNKFR